MKNDTFSIPAALGHLLRPALALKIVTFLKDFQKKTILFQSRPLRAACPDRPRRSKPLLFKRILNKKRYFFSGGRSGPLAPTGPGAQNVSQLTFNISAVREIQNEVS